MTTQMTGTIALVTGANRGIGRTLVEALLERGAAKVYATARRPEALADLVARGGNRVVPLRLDITRPSEVHAVAARANDVRILINNAGILAKFGGDPRRVGHVAAARDEFEVKVLGAWSVTQAFAPMMQERPGATIVNIGSVASFAAFPSVASYSVSKAALTTPDRSTRIWPNRFR